MATTIKISDTLNWIAGLIVQRPTTGVGGVAGEPGLTSANKVMATILGPPFRWQWNRTEVSVITTGPGVPDYTKNLPTFGWLEKAWWTNAGMNPTVKELEVFQTLGQEAKQNPPQKIAPILDDNAGNITFRLFPPPDQPQSSNYQVTLQFQKAPVLAASVSGLWSPIPDKLSYLYETGLLAHMQAIYSPQLYAMNIELFYRQLVGAAQGLSETEKNIFLEDKLRELRMQTTELAGAQQPKR